MFRIWKNCVRFIAAIGIVLGSVIGAMAEDDAPWLVSKSSGEVWITAEGVQQASLAQEAQLKSGDTIRTGRNGRVLLTRGEETILVSPNSVIGIPTEKKQGLSTTILQQAGSILLEVERRNVKHFEVETPYLAAVVKGTQFRISVNATGTSVDVLRGQVEVADFKSGQIAQVLPGQVATAFARGKSGLSLSGSGALSPIEQGKPRAPSIQRIMVPKVGLTAPRSAGIGQQIRTLGPPTHTSVKLGAAARPAGLKAVTRNASRISSPLGEVQLNIHKVTNGLAHAAAAPTRSGRSEATKDTVWSSNDAKASTAIASGSNQGNSVNGANTSNSGSGGSSAAGLTSTASGAVASGAVAAASAATTSSSSSGSTGNGRGNSGSSQGNNGNHGDGNNGNHGDGNNGNHGDGNNGNGNNGNGNGHGKK